MKGKIIICIVIAILIVIVSFFVYICRSLDNGISAEEEKEYIREDFKEDSKGENGKVSDVTNDGKSLVLYFSATGNTKRIADYIVEITAGDSLEIIPKESYTTEDLDYNQDGCRANREQNDATARPEIANEINIGNYEVIYLGYPIWWGDVPKIILTLLENYDFSGKTVIPFCTSGGSAITQSLHTLQKYDMIHWKEGRRFSGLSSKSDVETWINELGL